MNIWVDAPQQIEIEGKVYHWRVETLGTILATGSVQRTLLLGDSDLRPLCRLPVKPGMPGVAEACARAFRRGQEIGISEGSIASLRSTIDALSAVENRERSMLAALRGQGL